VKNGTDIINVFLAQSDVRCGGYLRTSVRNEMFFMSEAVDVAAAARELIRRLPRCNGANGSLKLTLSYSPDVFRGMDYSKAESQSLDPDQLERFKKEVMKVRGDIEFV